MCHAQGIPIQPGDRIEPEHDGEYLNQRVVNTVTLFDVNSFMLNNPGEISLGQILSIDENRIPKATRIDVLWDIDDFQAAH